MPEEIVPKEQMEVFNQGRTERRPSLPPRRMAEAPMEEAISEVPMEQEEVMDSGLSRSDPKTLLADFGTFLLVQKFGGEEAMAMEEPMQPQPLAQAQPQMPMQAEQPPVPMEQGRGLA